MTPAERENPDLINANRKKRIADGSGTTIQQVNNLLKQFSEMRRMMKTVNKGALPGNMNKMKALGR
jgi:signal recognition particle subunit SRP54